jgi:YgiT-type zinc finger domain-containing protein
MNCVLCKSNLTKGNVNHIVDFNGHIVIIKSVPANICEQCGEYFIENDVALKLEKIIDEAKKNKAEIFIIKYSDMAA